MSSRRTRLCSLTLLFTVVALLDAGCAHRVCVSTSVPAKVGLSAPTNVVLMVGDGMGVSHITAAKVTKGELQMERLAVGGFVTTHPHGSFVTDSAASGTAYATGQKTVNGAISVDPEGTPLKTALEHAEERGMATGLVVTCSVTHATPAVFAAHVRNREEYTEIARQVASSGVDVLFGGGLSYFLPSGERPGVRGDGVDLVAALRERMPVALSPMEFRSIGSVGAAAALLAPDHPPTAPERDPDLAELTEKALEILARDEDGFFLMVEGSQIDWAAHENDHGWLVTELADFDDAVGTVIDFAERDGRTLVVVTADHETGAYGVLDGSVEMREVSHPHFGSEDHSAAMVPLLAYGPGSESFGGILDNTEVGRLLIGAVTRR